MPRATPGLRALVAPALTTPPGTHGLRTAGLSMSTAGHAEVEAFLASLGLEQHAHNLIYNGFYTSLDALRAADYHELLECNVRPVHARLIVSNLKGAPRRASSGSSGEAEVVSFLRSTEPTRTPPAPPLGT